jgi:hypothetical protein
MVQVEKSCLLVQREWKRVCRSAKQAYDMAGTLRTLLDSAPPAVALEPDVRALHTCLAYYCEKMQKSLDDMSEDVAVAAMLLDLCRNKCSVQDQADK